jgi:uncharacterized protein YbbC (DUF1343 family)
VSERVRTGLEVCLERPPPCLEKGRFGLLANQASVGADFRPAAELLAERFPGRLAALFSPQHGLHGERQDDMVESPHGRDPLLGVPVWSLYSDVRRPDPAMLQGLAALVVDLTDVGCRVYTFVWTLSLCLEACAEEGVTVVVLDRPNPLGGVRVEGNRLDPRFLSFVGRAAIPMRHALTLGELARLVNERLDVGAELLVVPAQGWRRADLLPQTGLPWVPPSPNLPRFEGAQVYPGQVLLEGTNLSEGRGTTTPFELCGAPFVDPHAWRREVARIEEPAGVVLRPLRFEPTFHKYQGQSCGGLFLHVVDAGAFRPYRTTLTLLAAARRLWPERFELRPPPYEYEREKMPLDCISGGERVRLALGAGSSFDRAVLDELCDPGEEWEALSRRYHLYS